MSKVVWCTEHGHDSKDFEDPAELELNSNEKLKLFEDASKSLKEQSTKLEIALAEAVLSEDIASVDAILYNLKLLDTASDKLIRMIESAENAVRRGE